MLLKIQTTRDILWVQKKCPSKFLSFHLKRFRVFFSTCFGQILFYDSLHFLVPVCKFSDHRPDNCLVLTWSRCEVVVYTSRIKWPLHCTKALLCWFCSIFQSNKLLQNDDILIILPFYFLFTEFESYLSLNKIIRPF